MKKDVNNINLGYTKSDDHEEQNRVFETFTFTTTDGETKTINDVWFKDEIKREAA